MIIAILITAFTRIKETDEERKGREPQLLAMRMMFATSYARAQAAATKLPKIGLGLGGCIIV